MMQLRRHHLRFTTDEKLTHKFRRTLDLMINPKTAILDCERLKVSVRRKADQVSRRNADRMVRKSMAKFPPRLYLVGDKILIRSRGRGKVSNTGVYEGEIIKTNYNRHTYKVRLEESGSKLTEKWFRVADLAAVTQTMETERRKLHHGVFKKVVEVCQCDDDACDQFAVQFCSNKMAQTCCQKTHLNCRIKKTQFKRGQIEGFCQQN